MCLFIFVSFFMSFSVNSWIRVIDAYSLFCSFRQVSHFTSKLSYLNWNSFEWIARTPYTISILWYISVVTQNGYYIPLWHFIYSIKVMWRHFRCMWSGSELTIVLVLTETVQILRHHSLLLAADFQLWIIYHRSPSCWPHQLARVINQLCTLIVWQSKNLRNLLIDFVLLF